MGEGKTMQVYKGQTILNPTSVMKSATGKGWYVSYGCWSRGVQVDPPVDHSVL